MLWRRARGTARRRGRAGISDTAWFTDGTPTDPLMREPSLPDHGTHPNRYCDHVTLQVMWVEQLPPGLARDHRRRAVESFRRHLFAQGG